MIKYFAGHPTAANIVMVLFLAVGFLSYSSLSRSTFPDFVLGEVEVRVIYPGATAAEVEENVCIRLEDAVMGVSGLREMQCTAWDGSASLLASVNEEIPFDGFLDDIKTEVQAIVDLPELIDQIIIREKNPTDPVVTVAVSAEMDRADLRAFADDLRREIQALPLVSIARLQGFSARRYRIEVQEKKARAFGVSVEDIARQLKAQNIDRPAGRIEGREQLISVRVNQLGGSPGELGELYIHNSAGVELKLSELATISDSFEFVEEQADFNGRPAALLKVEMNKGDDCLNVMAELQKWLTRKKAELPEGIHISLIQDVSSIVKDRLDMLLNNGLQGFVLVMLVLLFFFNVRNSFWVAMGLPVSFMGGIFLMNQMDLTINMVSMVGLLMAIGLVLDDAIVISDNIDAYYRKHGDLLAAAVEGTKEVLPGVLSSYLTTIAVFGSLLFLQGDLGRVFRDMPAVLLVVMTASLVEAFLILPHHLKSGLKNEKEPGKLRRTINNAFNNFRDGVFAGSVQFVLRHRPLFLGLVFGFLLVSMGLIAGRRVKFQAMPPIDGDIIEARLLLNQGSTLDRTKQVVSEIIAALRRVEENYHQRYPQSEPLVKGVLVRYNQNPDAMETGPHAAMISVDLLTANQRFGRLKTLIAAWRSEVGSLSDVISLSFKEPVIGPAGKPVEIRISGENLFDLAAVAARIRDFLAVYIGLDDLNDDLIRGKQEFHLELKPGALLLGLNAGMVASQLRAVLQGEIVTEAVINGESLRFAVQLAINDQRNPEFFYDFTVKTPSGNQVPLRELAELKELRAFSHINRIDARRMVTVTAEADPLKVNVLEVLGELKEQLLPAIAVEYPEVNIAFEGEMRKISDTAPSMRRAILIGLLAIFLILSFQFGSFKEPLLIMMAIPLALIGVVFGHFIMGYNLTMPSMVGMISLGGIVVNNSILLVQFIKYNGESMPLREAIIQASCQRLRPILVTTGTTVAGMMPLLVAQNLQAQVIIPLVISVIFGLVSSSLLVLYAIPVLWTLGEKDETGQKR
jgi:multidrug efflux pump subunit AcrB